MNYFNNDRIKRFINKKILLGFLICSIYLLYILPALFGKIKATFIHISRGSFFIIIFIFLKYLQFLFKDKTKIVYLTAFLCLLSIFSLLLYFTKLNPFGYNRDLMQDSFFLVGAIFIIYVIMVDEGEEDFPYIKNFIKSEFLDFLILTFLVFIISATPLFGKRTHYPSPYIFSSIYLCSIIVFCEKIYYKYDVIFFKKISYLAHGLIIYFIFIKGLDRASFLFGYMIVLIPYHIFLKHVYYEFYPRDELRAVLSQLDERVACLLQKGKKGT